jgi:hypothetical protein
LIETKKRTYTQPIRVIEGTTGIAGDAAMSRICVPWIALVFAALTCGAPALVVSSIFVAIRNNGSRTRIRERAGCSMPALIADACVFVVVLTDVAPPVFAAVGRTRAEGPTVFAAVAVCAVAVGAILPVNIAAPVITTIRRAVPIAGFDAALRPSVVTVADAVGAFLPIHCHNSAVPVIAAGPPMTLINDDGECLHSP